MKNNHLTDYMAPAAKVIYLNTMKSIMVTSSIDSSTSESFQNESEFESIW